MLINFLGIRIHKNLTEVLVSSQVVFTVFLLFHMFSFCMLLYILINNVDKLLSIRSYKNLRKFWFQVK